MLLIVSCSSGLYCKLLHRISDYFTFQILISSFIPRLLSYNHLIPVNLSWIGLKDLISVVLLRGKYKKQRILELLSALTSIMTCWVSLHTINVSLWFFCCLFRVLVLLLLGPWHVLFIIFAVAGTTVETGSVIEAVVLDVSKTDHLVDLSLKADFIDKFKESSRNQNKKV